MRNPWCDLPAHPPFVLESDRRAVERFNATRATGRTLLHTELLPEPFIGDPTAPVIVLMTNPGFSPHDPLAFQDPRFQCGLHDNLAHRYQEYPFYLIDPALVDAPGHRWWTSTLQHLINHFGVKKVARNVLCLEFFPYHSQDMGYDGPILPSQRYTFSLLRQGMERGALVVLMRSLRAWRDNVPELADYPHFVACNPRSARISRANLPNGYPVILRRLAAC